MSTEEHVGACALAMERQHGPRAPLVIAEYIGALALADDREGIAMWKDIAACIDRLMSANGAIQAH